MKKKILTGIIVGAALLGVAGCSGGGSVEEGTTAAEATTSVTTTTTTTQETTESETTSETTTQEETAESESETTTEAPASTTAADADETQGSGANDSKVSGITVKKAADGFNKVSELEYDSSGAVYIYSLLSDSTRHEVESILENEEAVLTDSQTGTSGDIMYVKGRTDTGYSVVAFRRIGLGDTTAAYASIQYLSENDVSVDTVTTLLSDEYISY